MTAGYSSPPAVQCPPELWSTLPPEQTHKLPANTKQPPINYPLPHRGDYQLVIKRRLPCFSLQQKQLPSSHFPLSILPAAVVDSLYRQYFGHFSLTTSHSHPPAADSANAALQSVEIHVFK